MIEFILWNKNPNKYVNMLHRRLDREPAMWNISYSFNRFNNKKIKFPVITNNRNTMLSQCFQNAWFVFF